MIRDSREDAGRSRSGPLRSLGGRVDMLLLLLAVVVSALLWNMFGGAEQNPEVVEQPLPPARQPLPAGEPETPAPEPVDDPQVASLAPEQGISAAGIPKSGRPVRFLMQNVENYFVAGERTRSRFVSRPKSAESRDAVADVIASARPEIVGLVEVGGPVSLQDLRERLAKRGLEYPYYRVLPRQGEDRALAVLSRHPIVQDRSVANYHLYGEHRRTMLRGILDVVVRLDDGRLYRILGAHLKSHVADDQAAAASLRNREALTLSMYIQRITRDQPNIPTLVYGDWNDGPAESAVKQIVQGVSTDSAMHRLSPQDSRGQGWTIYYKAGHEYCTYDHIFVNKALKFRLKKNTPSGVVDIPAAKRASDHRALWCDLL